MRLLLDTAVFIFAVDSTENLSPRLKAALQNPKNALEISSISLSEIAIKSAIGKLRISEEITHQAIEDLGLRVMPFTSEHAFHLFELPLHHRDPFDRQIIAQALAEKIPLATPDEKFGFYEGLKVIW